MPAQPGNKYGGRKKGVPNKATQNAREAIGRFVDGNAHRVQEWLDKIEKEDGPKAAFDCYLKLIEFHVPRLSRAEITGENGGPVQVVIQGDDAGL